MEVMNHLDQPDNIGTQNDFKSEIQIEKEMLVPTIDSIDDDKGQKISDAIFSLLSIPDQFFSPKNKRKNKPKGPMLY